MFIYKYLSKCKTVEFGDQLGQSDWAVVRAEEGGAIINSYFPCLHNASVFVRVNAFELFFLQSTEFRTISSDQILALAPIAVLLPNGSKLDMVDDRGRAEATPRSKQKTTRDKKNTT